MQGASQMPAESFAAERIAMDPARQRAGFVEVMGTGRVRDPVEELLSLRSHASRPLVPCWIRADWSIARRIGQQVQLKRIPSSIEFTATASRP